MRKLVILCTVIILVLLPVALVVGCKVEPEPAPPPPTPASIVEESAPKPEPEVQVPPSPAAFSLSSFSVRPMRVTSDEKATASITVTNTGGTRGNYIAILSVDGEKQATRDVVLGPGDSQTVTFDLPIDQVGTYLIDIDGERGTLYVAAPQEALLEITASCFAERDPSGALLTTITVELTNVGGAPAKDINISTQFLDSLGNMFAYGKKLSIEDIIMPGTTRTIRSRFTSGTSRTVTYFIQFRVEYNDGLILKSGRFPIEKEEAPKETS